MNVRNEIKAQIIRAGMTMQEVVDLLSDEYGWSDSKDGRSDAPATSPRSSRPHRHTAVLPMDGSERYAFRCRRLQREVHRNSFMQTG